MSNRVNIIATKFEDISTSDRETTFGYRAFDDGGQVYCNTLTEEQASLPDLELLRLICSEDFLNDELSAMLQFTRDEKTGITINGNWHLWDEIKDIMFEEEGQDDGTVSVMFVSVWDGGTEIRTSGCYDPKTGRVESQKTSDAPVKVLDREYIEFLNGDEMDVCPVCHEYVLKTAMKEADGTNLEQVEVCSNPDCENSGA